MNKPLGVLVLGAVAFMGASARADLISEAQNLRTEYYGSFQLDSDNPASVMIETLMPDQKIEIRLRSRALNSAPLDILGLLDESAPNRSCSAKVDAKDNSCQSSSVTPVTFSMFQVWVDGCNFSDAIATQCNAASGGPCWSNSAISHIVPSANQSLGSEFSMAQSVVLNTADLTGCAGTPFNGFHRDKKYLIEFKEALNQSSFVANAGGRVDYEIVLTNQPYSSTSRHRRHPGR